MTRGPAEAKMHASPAALRDNLLCGYAHGVGHQAKLLQFSRDEQACNTADLKPCCHGRVQPGALRFQERSGCMSLATSHSGSGTLGQ